MVAQVLSNLKDLNVMSIPGISLKQKTADIPIKTLPYKKSHVLAYRTMFGGENSYQMPEYNLSEICAAEDADGIIRRAIQKKRALADKEGYSLVGKNNRTIQYMQHRFIELSIAQNFPMELLIKDSVGDLVRFHSCFWRKVRDNKASSGHIRKVKTINGEKKLLPVAAYFRMPPETMKVMTDKYGNPKYYMQLMPDGRYEEFAAEDIIHYKHNRRAGLNFPAPGLLPAVDDVKSLRRMEESVELLVDQHLFPLFTLQIGTDEFPVEVYPDGTTEVDVWTAKINNMPTSGGLVVSHRLKFDVIETKNSLAVEKYLEHFKKRSYTSAGVSNLDMGEGDGMNRSTADNASKILIEDVKDYQKEFMYQFQFEVVNELLLEGFNSSVFTDENVVRFQFNEIDADSMIKTENHNALMYSMHYLNEDEMRIRGRQPVIDGEESRNKMYVNQVEKPMAEHASQMKAKENAAKNSAKNKNTPANQHGSKSGPTGRKSSMERSERFLSSLLNDFYHYERDFTKIRVKNWLFTIDVPENAEDIYSRLNYYVDELVDSAYDMFEKEDSDPLLARDIMIEKLINLI